MSALPWVPEAFHAWFPVSSLQSELHEKQGFSFAARVEDNKARPRSFFATRAFGRTTREKPLVPRVLVRVHLHLLQLTTGN